MPAYHEIGRGAHARARGFYRQLAGAGLLADLPAPSVVFTSDAFPLRALARLATEFALRTIENLLSVTGDVLDALMFLEVFRQNVERLPFKAVGGASFEARDLMRQFAHAGLPRRPRPAIGPARQFAAAPRPSPPRACSSGAAAD